MTVRLTGYKMDYVANPMQFLVLPNVELAGLLLSEYRKVHIIKLKYKLDFDDSYQTSVADNFGLTIATLDKDYRKVASDYKVEFVG